MSAESNSPFAVIESESYFVLKLSGELGVSSLADFAAETARLTGKHVLVNCENLSGMDRGWLRALVGLAQALGKHNFQMRLFSAVPKVESFLRAEGVEQVLKNAPNLRDAQVQLKLVSAKVIDMEFINPFLGATMKVLEVQAKTLANPAKPYLKKEKEKSLGDISGVIGLVSEAFCGSVVISFPEKTFLAVMSRMLGENYQSISPELESGAGELTNIIFGQAKISLNEKGYGIKTALPSVVTGKDHSLASAVKGVTVVVPFKTEVGDFFVEINTESP